MSQATQLYDLQQTDTKIAETKQRLQTIAKTLENDEAVQQATEAVQQVETKLTPLKTKATNLDLEIASTISKFKATEERLYSGTVNNPKELEEMQQEITSLKKRQAELEETAFNLMMEIEQTESTLQEKQTHLDETIAARQSENKALVSEQRTKTQQLEDLAHKRSTLRDTLDTEQVQQYDKLQGRLRGPAVIKMNSEGTCTYCGVQQTRTNTKEIRRGHVMQCSNCQRILVT